MKSPDAALEIRGRIFTPSSRPSGVTTPRNAKRLMTFVAVGAGPAGVEMAGQLKRIDASVKIWAAGMQANPLAVQLAQQCGAQSDQAGRVQVTPELSLLRHPQVMVIGEMVIGVMLALDQLPGVAQVAIQTERYACFTSPSSSLG